MRQRLEIRLKEILIVGAALTFVVGGAVWFAPGVLQPAVPAECAFIDATEWPETVSSPSNKRFDVSIDAFFGLHTGMTGNAACATMVKSGFELTEHSKREIAFGSPEKDMSFVKEMIFEAMSRPLGVEYDSLATVTVFVGAPVSGYQVEQIEVGYFFANQDTPEPENEAIRQAVIANFGEPTSADFEAGAPDAYWVFTQDGLGTVPADEACDHEHLQHRGPGAVLSRPADKSCLGLLSVSYGGNMNEEITTARYLRYSFLDNERVWASRRREHSVSNAYRKSAVLKFFRTGTSHLAKVALTR